jgi:hypothetical protein
MKLLAAIRKHESRLLQTAFTLDLGGEAQLFASRRRPGLPPAVGPFVQPGSNLGDSK